MKTLLKLLAVAAAFGMAPAAVAQQATTTPAAAQPAAAPPGDTVSAPSQAVPAPAGDATAAPAAAAAKAPAYVLPKPDYIGQPDHDIHIQNQVTPIGREAAWFHNVLLVPSIVIMSTKGTRFSEMFDEREPAALPAFLTRWLNLTE